LGTEEIRLQHRRPGYDVTLGWSAMCDWPPSKTGAHGRTILERAEDWREVLWVAIAVAVMESKGIAS